MPRLEREREAKLALLEALASSQRAVARMLESAADLNARFPGDRSALLARLAALQLAMCESLLGVKLRRLMRGRPGSPWLADDRLRARSPDGEAEARPPDGADDGSPESRKRALDGGPPDCLRRAPGVASRSSRKRGPRGKRMAVRNAHGKACRPSSGP